MEKFFNFFGKKQKKEQEKNIGRNIEKNIEKKESGVFERDNNFFMYLGDKNDYVKIPKKVYEIAKVGLWVEDRIKKNELNNKFPSTGKWRNSVNCHYTVYRKEVDDEIKKNINLINDEGKWSSDNIKGIFEISERASFEDISGFKKFIFKKLGNEKFGVCEIEKDEEYIYADGDIDITRFLLHSFYLGISEKNSKIICFEKMGYYYKFRIVELEKIFERYNSIKRKNKKIFYGVKLYSEFIKQDEAKNPFF